MKEIGSILKAAEVMKCIGTGENKLSNIARALSYDKATVYRILKTLEKVGFAVQDPVTKQFYHGPLLHSLSGDFLKAHKILNEIALKHMEALRDTTAETVNLQIPLGADRVIIEIVFMVREYMYYAKIGDRYPIYSGAAGKVLLSMLSDNDLMILLNKVVYLPSAKELINEEVFSVLAIKNAAVQGHAIEFYTSPVNSGAFSVPVKNYFCPVALTVVGLENQLRTNQEQILKELKKASKKIAAELAVIYK